MSRCFPFPPPGYETKARSDNTSLLGKEKHKEKKHKKEKRDKEKRESKERKEKDQSKEKHKERKDRKEKHRDKKKDKDRDKDKKKISNDKRTEDHILSQNGEKLGESSHKAEDIKDSKFAEELGRRIREEERGAGNQMVENISGKIHRKIEGMANSAEKGRGMGTEMAQNLNNTEQRRVGMASAMVEKGTRDGMVHGFVKPEQTKIDGMDRSLEKEANKSIERKDKTKEMEADDKRGDNHKDRDREKKHRRKDKDTKNGKEKEEKAKEKGEHRHKEQGKHRDNGKEHIDTLDVRSLFPPKDSKRSAGTDGNLKRKEVNGFLHENDVRPNKLLRPASSSQPPVENGRKVDLYNNDIPHASEKLEALNNLKLEKVLDKKECEINGTVLAQPPSMSGPPLIADSTENGDATMKLPPHPDEKYLSLILSVPKMEEWPETDDQLWLFSRDDLRQKPKTKLEADETPQVWAGALRIESADVLALPYVIPY